MVWGLNVTLSVDNVDMKPIVEKPVGRDQAGEIVSQY